MSCKKAGVHIAVTALVAGLIASGPPASAQSGGSSSIGFLGDFPVGAVVAFNAVSCPEGWSPLTLAEGRVVVGTGVADGQAYALGDTGGSALHQLTIDEMPSHSHPTDHGLLASDQTNTQGLGDSWWRHPGTGTDYMVTGTSVGGDQPHENRPPYFALLYCQKTLGTPAGAVVAFNAVSCPEGWSPLALAEGRVVVGTGMADGQAYALGDTGGSALHQLTIEEMPSHSHPTDHGLLQSDRTNMQGLGDSWWRHPGTGTDYMVTGTSVGGDQPHENRPPYVALLHCQKN
ncbi:MAG: hypothetical protein ACTS10_12555 [Kiloniellales bacterium]